MVSYDTNLNRITEYDEGSRYSQKEQDKGMNYWLDLFTGTTWREFRDAGASVSGFSAKRRRIADRLEKGDILLCYLTGVMRWIGALEVGNKTNLTDRIWKDQNFRFDSR